MGCNYQKQSSFLVVFEDGAGVAWLLFVMGLMGLNHLLEISELDDVTSIIVRLILVSASLILARESRSLLMGEGIAPIIRDKIAALAENDDALVRTKIILSNYQLPEEVVLMLIIDFEDNVDTEGITDFIQLIRQNIKTEFKLVRFVIIQPE